MFSKNIDIMTGDGHIIYDTDNRQFICAKDVTIGNRVWMGMNSAILKGVNIPDGCIIGANSLVTKSFDTPNSAICGSPAKCVKSGLYWNTISETQMAIAKNEDEIIKKALSSL